MDDDIDWQRQEDVGLPLASVQAPLRGDRTSVGRAGPNINSCIVHMKPVEREDARTLWNMIPQPTKDNPNAQQAQALARLAAVAGVALTPGVLGFVPNGDIGPESVEYYVSPGSPIITGLSRSNRFARFLHANQDDGHCVKWQDMTGKEQFKWHDLWKANVCPVNRIEAATRGLRGADLARITTVDGVRAAMQLSPSVAKRIPKVHQVAKADWNRVKRQLDL